MGAREEVTAGARVEQVAHPPSSRDPSLRQVKWVVKGGRQSGFSFFGARGANLFYTFIHFCVSGEGWKVSTWIVQMRTAHVKAGPSCASASHTSNA